MLNAHAEHVTITDALAWDCLEGECEHVTDEVDDTSNCPRIEVIVCVDCMDEHEHGRDPYWWEDLIPWPCDPASRLGVAVYGPDPAPPIFKPQPADPVHPPMPVGHIRACGCPECVAWLEAHEPEGQES